MTAHHAVLITNVIEREPPPRSEIAGDTLALATDAPEVLQTLIRRAA